MIFYAQKHLYTHEKIGGIMRPYGEKKEVYGTEKLYGSTHRH